MRVLLVNRFFWPDESATAMLASDIAQALVRAGHEVRVACSRALYDRPDARLPAREVRDGVVVRRLPSTLLGSRSSWRRLLDAATFHASLALHGRLGELPDAILAMTDPPLVLATAARIPLRRGGRLVHLAADLYPDLAVALGVLAPRAPLTRWLRRRARHALARCDAVLALGERMRERLLELGVPAERVLVTSPWAVQLAATNGAPADNPFRSELGLEPDDCAVMYAGTMGRCHPSTTLLEALRALAGETRLHWVFVGGGTTMEELRGQVAALGLSRVHFRPYQPRPDLARVLASGDLHLVLQDPRTVGLCVPSKLAGILAAARPVLFVGSEEAEIADSVRRFGCGRVVREGDAPALVAALRALAADPEERRRLGEAGRRGFERELTAERVLSRVVAAIEGRAPTSVT